MFKIKYYYFLLITPLLFSNCTSEAVLSEVAKKYENFYQFSSTMESNISQGDIPVVTQGYVIANAFYKVAKSENPNRDTRIDLSVFESDGVTLHAKFVPINSSGTFSTSGSNTNYSGNTLYVNLTSIDETENVLFKAGQTIGVQEIEVSLVVKRNYEENGVSVPKEATILGSTKTFKVLIDQKKTNTTASGYVFEPFVLGYANADGSSQTVSYWTKPINIDLENEYCVTQNCSSRLYTSADISTIISEFGSMNWKLPTSGGDFTTLIGMFYPAGNRVGYLQDKGSYGETEIDLYNTLGTNTTNYTFTSGYKAYWVDNCQGADWCKAFINKGGQGIVRTVPNNYALSAVFKYNP